MNKYFSIIVLASLLPGCNCKKAADIPEEKPAVEVTEQSSIKEIRNEADIKKYDKAIVKLYTQWCGACKMSTPVVQEMAAKYPDIAFLAVDIDEEGDFKDKYPVQGVPTFIVFEKGKKVATILGFNKNKIQAEIDKLNEIEKKNDSQPATQKKNTKAIKNKKELDQEIKKGKSIVRFYGDWCGFCKMIEPDYEKLADEFGNKINFVNVEITENQDLAEEHNIKGVPAFAAFKDGKKTDSMSGANKEGLKKMVKNLAK